MIPKLMCSANEIIVVLYCIDYCSIISIYVVIDIHNIFVRLPQVKQYIHFA